MGGFPMTSEVLENPRKKETKKGTPLAAKWPIHTRCDYVWKKSDRRNPPLSGKPPSDLGEGIGVPPRPSDLDLGPLGWGPLPSPGGVGYYVNTQKTRITGIRVGPPKRDLDAYYADKRATKETNGPAKPDGPSRRTFADHTYKRERAKSKTRGGIHSAERRAAAEIRRLGRELREREHIQTLGNQKSTERIPSDLQPAPPSKVTQDSQDTPTASSPAIRSGSA